MILVRKKYLYILTFLFCLLVVFGEVKFFFALKSIALQTNLEVKYEVENFIFASIMLFMIVIFFLVNLIRVSDNMLKKLDKMIELSEYGEHDISVHLKEMGVFGIKVNYLMFQQNRLNDIKTLKISSLSGVNNFLMERIGKMIFIVNRQGEVTDCSKRLEEQLKSDKGKLIGKNIDTLLKGANFEELFASLAEMRKPITKEGLEIEIDGKTSLRKAAFYPVINAGNEVSHMIAVIEDPHEKGLFGRKG